MQVSFFVDPWRRDPEDLLDSWSGLTVPAEAALDLGCDVAVVHGAAMEATLQRKNVPYHFVRARAPSLLHRALGRWSAPITSALIERVASLAPEVVHVHGLSYPRHVARLVARLPGVPVVLQDHADRPPPSWRLAAYRESLRGIAGVLFTAREQAEPFFACGALPAGLPVFEVIESTSRFTTTNIDTVRRLTHMSGTPCFLWAGRLDANKDPLTVLEAFSAATASLPDARLWMCYTDAPLLRAARTRIRSDAQLEGRVTLLGRLAHSDVEQLMRSADFLLLGSHHEGSGYAVIEAMACGATPLVTDIPSLRRITGNGAVGALSPPGDARAMTRAMIEWAGHDPDELRQAAREHFERSLSLSAIGRELRSAYQAVVAAARGGEAMPSREGPASDPASAPAAGA